MRLMQFEFIVFSFIITAFAQVSITGSVKNGAGKGVSGADISIAKNPSISAKSRSDGSFSLSETAVNYRNGPIHEKIVRVHNFSIDFSTDLTGKSISVTFYSLNGKKVLFRYFDQLKQNERSIDISFLPKGSYIMVVTIDGRKHFFRFSNVISGLSEKTINKTTITKKSAVLKMSVTVDTLVVAKSGYKTNKIPLSSYFQNGIEVTLDTTEGGAQDSLKKGLTVYFIRHAETVANASGENGGSGPIENHDTLTALGEKQVQELKNYLIKENINPDVIIVSPAWRAQKTIEPFLTATKSTAQIWVELNECCGQEPTGDTLPTERPKAPWKLKIEKFSDNFTFRTSDDIYFWYPQSYEEGLFMVMTARNRLLEQFSQSGKIVIAVGHAVNGGIFLGLLRGYDMISEKPSRPVYLMNTGVYKLTQDTINGLFTLKQNINNPPTE